MSKWSFLPSRVLPRELEWRRLESLQDSERLRAARQTEMAAERAMERGLITGSEFVVPGFCWTCSRTVAFGVNYSYAYPVDGVLTPNWREHLHCPVCKLCNRIRATVHFFEARLRPTARAEVYVTEQRTPLYRSLAARHRNLVGSEYLGQRVPFGESSPEGVRNESLTNLSFPAASFDFLISLDVFEHMPDFRRALAECHRVLRPGGALLFSVPFEAGAQENLVRARQNAAGEIEHLLPPEYHGDPLSTDGCLAFYKFGWDLLDDVRAAGFADVAGYSFWSPDWGYLGADLLLFSAAKGS